MRTLIRNGRIEDDDWTLLNEASGPEVLSAAPGRKFIVPLKFHQLHRDEIERRMAGFGVWLDSDEYVRDIGEVLHTLPLVALNFPVFSDGRSYTNARELREQSGYQGEIRAIGDVLRDQLFLMSRCGFNAFSLRHDQDAEACLRALDDFATSYQSTVVEPAPLFRRR